MAMQVKVLRVLEDGQVQRVGGRGQIPVNVRIVAATHRHLGDAIDDGRFREDLFYRLAVYPLFVPTLQERSEDIADLMTHFMAKAGLSSSTSFSERAIVEAARYPWPGNVRELRNVVQRAILLHSGRQVDDRALRSLLRPADRRHAPLPTPLRAMATPPPPHSERRAEMALQDGDQPLDLPEMLANLEQRYITRALSRADGNVSEAARLLSLQRTTLIGKLQKYDIARITA